MRPAALVLPLCAALAGGCDRPLTAPDAGKKPEHLLIGTLVSGWTWQSLPFLPYGINDAGVVVGTVNGYAVQWQNGSIYYLPIVPGVPGPYQARRISSKGIIVGVAAGGTHLLVWTSPSAQPIDVTVSGMMLDPKGINDNLTVVFNASQTGHVRAMRWTPSGGAVSLPGADYGDEVDGLNSSGYAAGWVATPDTPSLELAARWDPSGNLTLLPSIDPMSRAAAINDAGAVAGNSLAQVSATTWTINSTLVWGLNGSLSEYLTLPKDWVVGLSNAGRIIASDNQGPWTYFNGALTWLPWPTADVDAPFVMGVNTCGWIVGQRRIGEAGLLWHQSGIRATCDQQQVIAAF